MRRAVVLLGRDGTLTGSVGSVNLPRRSAPDRLAAAEWVLARRAP